MIKILFCGDFAPCGEYEQLVESDPEGVFGGSLDVVKKSDISFINLECVLTDKDDGRIFKRGPHLRASSKCIKALKSFSVVGLANNHIMDYGEKGLLDTITLCKKNRIRTIGASTVFSNKDKIFYKKIRGAMVAIIAMAEKEFNFIPDAGVGVNLLDSIDAFYQIKEAKNKADIVIVTIHGGNEYFPYPNPKFRKVCKYLIDLGVNAIVCHHAHIPGSFESYKGVPIFYSIGNYIFDAKNKPNGWGEGYMVEFEFNEVNFLLSKFNLFPYTQSVDSGGVNLLGKEEKVKFQAYLSSLNKILDNERLWMDEWVDFAKKRKNQILIENYFPVIFRGVGTIIEKLSLQKIILNRFNIRHKINIQRCDSHQELLSFSLEDFYNKTKK